MCAFKAEVYNSKQALSVLCVLTVCFLSLAFRTSDMKYGDLEVFLFGLELGQFHSVFIKHQVDFALLLTLSEDDLINVCNLIVLVWMVSACVCVCVDMCTCLCVYVCVHVHVRMQLLVCVWGGGVGVGVFMNMLMSADVSTCLHHMVVC